MLKVERSEKLRFIMMYTGAFFEASRWSGFVV